MLRKKQAQHGFIDKWSKHLFYGQNTSMTFDKQNSGTQQTEEAILTQMGYVFPYFVPLDKLKLNTITTTW